MVPFENNGPIELPPYGPTWRVIVTQIKSGIRLRLSAALPESVPNEGATDEHLAEIFKKIAPPNAKKMLRSAMKHWKKK
jgi:hypothetical protein